MQTLEDQTVQQTDLSASQQASLQTPQSMPLPGYELQTRLGQGAFGQVWSAVQQSTQQPVAVKLLTQFSLELEREVARLRQVSEHPYVVGLLDANLDHRPPFLVMPLLQRSLSGAVGLNQDTPHIPLTQMVTWLEQASSALRYVHNRGLLHCDLKPANFLIDSNQDLRVADFGQALADNDSEQRLGTLFYMPPEQAMLEPAPVPSVGWDVYALGASFYQLLTGRLPRGGGDLRERLSGLPSTREVLKTYAQALRQQPLVPIRQLNARVDADLAAILEHCLEIAPERRYADMAGLLEDLRRRRLHIPLACRAATPTYVISRFFRRHRASVSVAALGAVALALTVSLAFQRISRERERALHEAARAREALADFSMLSANKESGPQALLEMARAVDQSEPGSPKDGLRRLAFGLQLQMQPRLVKTFPDLELAGEAGPLLLDPSHHRLLITHPDSQQTGWLDWQTGARQWLNDVPEEMDQAQFAAGQLALRGEEEIQLGETEVPGADIDWMQLSPDGKVLATGDRDEDTQQLTFLDARSGKPLGPAFTVPAASDNLAQFSPDCAFFALTVDNKVQVFSLHPPRLLWDSGTVKVLQASIWGSDLILRELAGLRRRRLKDGAPLPIGNGVPGSISIALGSVSQHLLVASHSWLLDYFQDPMEPAVFSFPQILSMAGDSTRMALGGADGRILLFAGDLHKPAGSVQGDGPVQWVFLAQDQVFAFCAQPDLPRQGTLYCWDWREERGSGAAEVELLADGVLDSKGFQPWKGERLSLSDCSVFRQTPAGLVLADAKGQVYFVDSQTGKLIRRLQLPVAPGAIRPDGKAALLAENQHQWREVSLEDGHTLRQEPLRAWTLERPEYSLDGSTAVAIDPGSFSVYQLFHEAPVAYEPQQIVRHMLIQDDYLVAGGWIEPGQPSAALLWKLGDGGGEPLASFAQPDILVSLDLNQRGDRLLTASGEGTISIWDFPARGKVSPRLRLSHGSPLLGARYSPRQNLIVSWGSQGEVRLWEATTGTPIGPVLPGSFGTAPVFSADGDLITWVNGRERRWSLQGWKGSGAEALARQITGLQR